MRRLYREDFKGINLSNQCFAKGSAQKTNNDNCQDNNNYRNQNRERTTQTAFFGH